MTSGTGNRLGKYEIQAELGRGGMGIVHRGYDSALHRPVAIKVLPQQLTYDAEFVRRFQPRNRRSLHALTRRPWADRSAGSAGYGARIPLSANASGTLKTTRSASIARFRNSRTAS